MSFNELPDAGSHRVQTEVRPGVEVEDDGFAVQIADALRPC